MSGATLILNGSPSPDGNSMALARRLAAALGGGISIVDLYVEPVRPCCGCGVCAASGDCPYEHGDAFAAIMRQVAAAPYTIMASPVHFSGLSAPLVGFISRFQLYWGRDVASLFPGVAGLVAAGGADYDGMFLAARKVAGAAFKTLGMPLAGMVGVGGTDLRPADADPGAPARLEALALAMQNRSRGDATRHLE